MRRPAIYPISFLALSLAASPVHSAPVEYVIERPHTQISFFSSHEGFSWSQGEFDDVSGRFRFDPANWSNSNVEVRIKTASLRFDDKTWDEHMRSPKFFNVVAFPDATFTSSRLRKTGDRSGVLEGELTLLGVTAPVRLDVTFNKEGIHSVSKLPVIGFSARGRLDRRTWGMATDAPLVASLPPDVELRIEVEGIRADAAPSTAQVGGTTTGAREAVVSR